MKISKILQLSLCGRNPVLPTSLILLITSRCNAKCGFCIFKNSINQNADKLTLYDFKNLSGSLKKLFRLHISGGETFLRDDLPEICEIFSKNNQVEEIGIPTNGIMTEKIAKLTEKILRSCPKTNLMISLSLDGPPKLHDKLRGVPGVFHKTINTYNELIKLKKKFPAFRVHVTTTISKYNYAYLDELIKIVKEKMPDLNSHNFEFVRGKPGEICPDLPTLSECQRFEEIHRKVVAETKNHFKSRLKSILANAVKNYKFHLLIEILKQKKQLIPCDAGKSIGVVNWSGDVYLCELLPKVGNFKQGGFHNAWHSKKAKEQRNFIAQKKCFCTHGCFQGPNIFLHPNNYLKIINHWITKK